MNNYQTENFMNNKLSNYLKTITYLSLIWSFRTSGLE